MAGEQWLRDAGYSTGEVQENEDEEDGKESLEIEVQLAAWTITRNFLQSTQGKGMLKLYGAGDPSGRGEAFSFIKASMKEMFVRSGESTDGKIVSRDPNKYPQKFSVVEQQYAYKEEVNRIFNAQVQCLSSKEDLLEDDVIEDEVQEEEPV